MMTRVMWVVMGCCALLPVAGGAQTLKPAQVREIARDAYIYGFPLVDNYRIQYAYFEDRSNPEYKTAWNQVYNTARVYTPADKAIQTPNSDTPYSFIGADLRTEPLVVTVPAIDTDRFYHAQFVDWYTFNFAYVGTRATGTGAGAYLLAGPHWKGDRPPGIASVIRSETEFVLVLIRTQLFGPDDLDNVKKVQAGYSVQPLSAFLKQPAPPPAPAIAFMKPLNADGERTSLEFFNELNFVLQFCAVHPTEAALMAKFERIGVGPGKTIDAASLAPEIRQAMEDGMADAWKAFAVQQQKGVADKVTSADLFGSRDYLKNRYLYRMMGAVNGIYGNSKEEAIYLPYLVDSTGEVPNGRHRYEVRFAAGEFPPANAFWSLTMYELPSQLLVANPLNRYLINSPMLSSLKKDAKGGLTLYVQCQPPGADKESNWLPAPSNEFFLILRLYSPKPDALKGKWTNPPLTRVP